MVSLNRLFKKTMTALLISGSMLPGLASEAFARCDPGQRCVAFKPLSANPVHDQKQGYIEVSFGDQSLGAVLRRTAPIGPNGNMHRGQPIFPGKINDIPFLTPGMDDLSDGARSFLTKTESVAALMHPGDPFYLRFFTKGEFAVLLFINGRNVLTGERGGPQDAALTIANGKPNYFVTGKNINPWFDKGRDAQGREGQLVAIDSSALPVSIQNSPNIQMVVVPMKPEALKRTQPASPSGTRGVVIGAGAALTQDTGKDPHLRDGENPGDIWDTKRAARLTIKCADARNAPSLGRSAGNYSPITHGDIATLEWVDAKGNSVGARYDFDPAYKAFIDNLYNASDRAGPVLGR